MKRMILAAAVLAGTASPVIAQGIAVHDNASLLKAIDQIRQTKEMIDQGKEQIAQAKQLYDDLNGLTDISRVASNLGNDALRSLDSGSASDISRGDYDFAGAARQRVDQVYSDVLGELGNDASDGAKQNARAVAAQAGVAETAGRSAAERKVYLGQLVDRLATARTAKEVQDLTARIEGERALMENDRLALDAIAMNREAEERAKGQRASNERIRALRAARGE